jgi:hypothetical protein
MSRLADWLRNARPSGGAYSDVNTQFGEDVATDPLFAVLREFSDAPAQPEAVPLHLLRQYSAAQKRSKGRKRLRLGASALLGAVIVVPGLAYAGVLPAPIAHAIQNVSHVFQNVLNVAHIPIQLPSLEAPSGDSSGQNVGTPGSDLPSLNVATPNSPTDNTTPGLMPIEFPENTVLAPSDSNQDSPVMSGPLTGEDLIGTGSGSPTTSEAPAPTNESSTMPGPTPTEELVATPGPTPTEELVATPGPTPTDESSVTPIPEPSPSDTPAPTDEPTPTPEPTS